MTYWKKIKEFQINIATRKIVCLHIHYWGVELMPSHDYLYTVYPRVLFTQACYLHALLNSIRVGLICYYANWNDHSRRWQFTFHLSKQDIQVTLREEIKSTCEYRPFEKCDYVPRISNEICCKKLEHVIAQLDEMKRTIEGYHGEAWSSVLAFMSSFPDINAFWRLQMLDLVLLARALHYLWTHS